MTASLELRGVRVAYGSRVVLPGIDLALEAGETVALLGPSGSGKTTLLGAVAGFVPLADGEILLDGRVIASRQVQAPPERRAVAVVFQGYALWPHMTALETVAYPLRRNGADREQAREAAAAILDQLGIAHLAHRRPAELSGGEQQRVGLGRALARHARVYLFDEPTAHLDAILRERLQTELADHRRRIDAAALYATHDSGEALAIADRVALLREGQIVQCGPPAEVHERPVDLWAARLTGPASALPIVVESIAGPVAQVALSDAVEGAASHPAHVASATAIDPGPATALVRPGWARLGGPLGARVAGVAYRGTHTDYRLAVVGGEVGIRMPGTPEAAAGDTVGWSLQRAWLLRSNRDEA